MISLLKQDTYYYQLLIIALLINVVKGEERVFPSPANIYNNRRLQDLCLGMITVVN